MSSFAEGAHAPIFLHILLNNMGYKLKLTFTHLMINNVISTNTKANRIICRVLQSGFDLG